MPHRTRTQSSKHRPTAFTGGSRRPVAPRLMRPEGCTSCPRRIGGTLGGGADPFTYPGSSPLEWDPRERSAP